MAIIKYENHTNMKAIKDRMLELNNRTFSFYSICREEIVKEIEKLGNKKLLKILISL